MKRVKTRFFPNVRIERDQKRGIIRVSFLNKELPKLSRMLGGLAIIIGWPFFSIVLTDGAVTDWLNGIDLMVALVIGGYMIVEAFFPEKVGRAVEIDLDRNRLRVLKNGRSELERPFSDLDNLTIEEHPDAAVARDRRAGNPQQQRMTMTEKQEALFGWFGPGGAEKVLMVPRYEWPPGNMLFEVRQALMWVIQGGTMPEGQAPKPEEKSINPPLD